MHSSRFIHSWAARTLLFQGRSSSLTWDLGLQGLCYSHTNLELLSFLRAGQVLSTSPQEGRRHHWMSHSGRYSGRSRGLYIRGHRSKKAGKIVCPHLSWLKISICKIRSFRGALPLMDSTSRKCWMDRTSFLASFAKFFGHQYTKSSLIFLKIKSCLVLVSRNNNLKLQIDW